MPFLRIIFRFAVSESLGYLSRLSNRNVFIKFTMPKIYSWKFYAFKLESPIATSYERTIVGCPFGTLAQTFYK